MGTWMFEPGHTEAEFRARHMMVTWVRGLFKDEADLTTGGVTRQVPLDVAWLGEWRTPFWEGDVNRGEMSRIGFEAATRVNRHDFGVSWQDEIPGGGLVVGNEIDIVVDV